VLHLSQLVKTLYTASRQHGLLHQSECLRLGAWPVKRVSTKQPRVCFLKKLCTVIDRHKFEASEIFQPERDRCNYHLEAIKSHLKETGQTDWCANIW